MIKLGETTAVHTPMFGVTCLDDIEPGVPVRLVNLNQCIVCETDTGDRDGIVDPFHKGTIPAGTVFAMVPDASKIGPVRHEFDILIEPEYGLLGEREETCRWCYEGG